MAATALAPLVDEEGSHLDAHAHDPKLSPREFAAYEDGLESLIRTIRKAKPGLEEIVFRNSASEAAGYIRSGFSRQIVIDRLNEAASMIGLNLNAEDVIDGYLSGNEGNGIAAPECPTLVPAERNDRERLKPIHCSELHRLSKRESLIEGLLDRGAVSLMYGPSGCGKTFFALDLAGHVALGRTWRGHAVLRGAVVYVAAEGGGGILERLTAFCCQHGIDLKHVQFYVIPEPIDLCNSNTDVDILIKHLGNLPNDQALHLLVIDTVSRALAGGNENSPDHMGAWLDAAISCAR
jgi:hypothetical protein